MYSYNVPIYYKNMHKTYTMMSLLWAAQQTEEVCVLKNKYERLMKIYRCKPDI